MRAEKIKVGAGGRAKRALGGGELKARDWPSALRRSAGMRGGSLGGRTRADVPTIPVLKRRPPWSEPWRPARR